MALERRSKVLFVVSGTLIALFVLGYTIHHFFGADQPIIISDSSVIEQIETGSYSPSNDNSHHYSKNRTVKSIQMVDSVNVVTTICSPGDCARPVTIMFKRDSDARYHAITIQPYSNANGSGTDVAVTDPSWETWPKSTSGDYDTRTLADGHLYYPDSGHQCNHCKFYVCFNKSPTSTYCP